jgi:peroxiredoxin
VDADGVYAHRQYADKHNIQVPLLSDTDGQVNQAYGVLAEEFEGHCDVTGRATFVVDSWLYRPVCVIGPKSG